MNIKYTSKLEKEFLEACKQGNLLKVKILLKAGVDPSIKSNEAIYWAVYNNHSEVVKLLMKDPRVDPSAENDEAIYWAAFNGHAEVVKLLLKDPRVNPSAKNNKAIFWATLNGHTEVVKLLLQDPRVQKNLSEDELKKIKGE